MSIVYGEAIKDDIDELIRLRIAYMIDDFGSVSEHESSFRIILTENSEMNLLHLRRKMMEEW